MKLQLVSAPHSTLLSSSKKIITWDKRLADTVSEMILVLNACKDPEGVGLAAPQVGLPLRLFLMKPDSKAPITICINPVLIDVLAPIVPSRENDILEGCLSIRNVWAHVDRAPRTHIGYYDEKGTMHSVVFSGFEARIIQHEMDHLEGILFTQRALEQKKTLYKTVRENNKETFEEIEL